MLNAAEIIILCLLAYGLQMSANLHGQPKTGKYNFWTALASSALTLALLYWAGLFR